MATCDDVVAALKTVVDDPVSAKGGFRLYNYIGGSFVDGVSDERIDDINPSTGKTLGTMPRSSAVDVANAVTAAESCLDATGPNCWSDWSLEERAALLERIAGLIETNLDLFAKLESIDQGKPQWLAAAVDVPRAVSNFRFFASCLRSGEDGCHDMGKVGFNYTLRTPVGIVGLITPWNLPLYLLSWKVAPAMATGNAIIAKPSEFTPLTALALCAMCHQAGLPAGAFNCLFGFGGECGQAIVESPKIGAISFTGGTVSGRRVAATASPLFKKLSLELGGKNAGVVFGDADLDKAIETAQRAGYTNQGEICLCMSRWLVHSSVYDKFVTQLTERVKAMTVGAPCKAESRIGALVSAQHLEKVKSYVKLAQEEGGVITTGLEDLHIEGGSEADSPYKNGYFMRPVVVTGLETSSRTAMEEIFGPVITIHKFETIDEAVAMANCTPYGLASSIFTSNLHTAHTVAKRIKVGLMWVNCWMLRDLRVPFGGVKESGVGREGGMRSLGFFTEEKNVTIALQ